MINGLARVGATVVHQGVAKVHVSGHASAGELLYLLNATRPRNVMPVHGEWRHLRAHAALAELTGVPADRVVLRRDGTVVDLVDGEAVGRRHVDVGNVYVDGLAVGDVGETPAQGPADPRRGGLHRDHRGGRHAHRQAIGMPPISGRGFSDDPEAFDPVLPLVEAELARVAAEGVTDPHRLAQAVRRVVGRWVADTYRRRPMIIPTVIEV